MKLILKVLFLPLLLLLDRLSSSALTKAIIFIILDQPVSYHQSKSDALYQNIRAHSAKHKVFRTNVDFRDVVGSWAFWPLVEELQKKIDITKFEWIFVCEDETSIDVDKLLDTLNKFNSDKSWFLGYALHDRHPTIIHHYAFINNASKFAYPDFAAGFTITPNLLQQLVNRSNFEHGFTIDAKHELAMILWDSGNGIELTHVPNFCTLKASNGTGTCATLYASNYEKCAVDDLNLDKNLAVAVKTCQKFHKTRIVVVKRTWSKEAPGAVEYFSDAEDQYIPTIWLGFQNTERGHCGKTMAIIKRFFDSFEQNKNKWLLILDDDTLISLKRLVKLLQCYNMDDALIIGERYGYGFDPNGLYGYDYPTGGSGMVFSPQAAKLLAQNCKCPALDSPDDMIIGLCASNLHIPIIHSSAFHQARPVDYSENYLKRMLPVSFHKHYEIDPYTIYHDYLVDPADQNLTVDFVRRDEL